MRRITTYTGLALFLTLGFAIASGCGTSGESGKWLDGVRAPAPTVSFTLPLNVAVNVATNTLVTATFSEKMEAETINITTFTLKNGSGTILGTVGYSGVSAVFTPAVPLAAGTKYTATITIGAKSSDAGTHLESDYVWTFTTAAVIPPEYIPATPVTNPVPNPGPAPDLRAPEVTSTVPVNLATGVATNTSIIATFNEAMNPLTLTDASFIVRKGGALVAGAVVPVGLTAVFTPNALLDSSAVYTATVTTDAKDLAGNYLAANYEWTFTTGALVDIIAPTVILTAPLNGATGVAIDTTVVATFSEAMAPLSLTPLTFTLYEGLNSIAHTVLPVLDKATLTPNVNLAVDTLYTATVTVGAMDLATNPLAAPYVWTFRTATPPAVVNPGLLAPYAIASSGGVTTGAALVKINGSTVLDPAELCNAVAVGVADDFGFCGGNPPLNNAPGVTDFVITPTHAAPGPVTSAAIKAELTAKWNSISPAGLPGGTVLGCGTIGSGGDAGALIGCSGNFTLPAGVYISQTSSSIGIAGNLVLDGGGDANATFVFQAPSTVTTAPGTTITLQNGAKASNVWWYVGSSATLNSNTAFNGNILASASISMGTSATSCGRLLSGASGAGAFTFLGNTVSVPGHASAPAGCN